MLKISLLAMLILVSSYAYSEESENGLKHESQLGYVLNGGNSESETTSFKQQTEYSWTEDVLKLSGHYVQSSGVVTDTSTGTSRNEITSENWEARLRYERVLTPKKFNVFTTYGWYGDRFQGVKEGYSTDLGGKYFLENSKVIKHFFELGYQYRKELLQVNPTPACVGVGSCGHPEFHYLRLYTQLDYVYSKNLSLGLWVEYLPSITDFSDDQRINYSPYLTSVLTDMFSLKVSYEGRYRYKTAAPGLKNTDYTFTTALVAKF